MALWTLADQQEIKPISQNNEYRFAELQQEVEENDIINLLGVELYTEITSDVEKFETLLNGGTFVENNLTISFRGLIYVCCYLLYANYVKTSSFQDTFSGFMMNNPEGQEKLNGRALDGYSDRFKQIAGTQYDLCKRYLISTGISEYFPLKEKKSFTINTL